MKTILPILAVLLCGASLAAGEEPRKASFADKDALTGWKVTGDVTVDNSKDATGKPGGSLKVGPGGKAIWPLRESNDAGKVEMYVYEEMKNPQDPKQRRVGPRWGLVQTDDRVLVMGVIYAPYLSGQDTYACSDSDQKVWFVVQHTRLKRSEGWHKWVFSFDPEAGLSITCDGKKALFDWNKTQAVGFSGVAVFGDNAKDDPQTVWVDDIAVTLGAPMKAKPTPAPGAGDGGPSLAPEKDPAPGKPVALAEAVRGKHPRLLFGAEDIAAIKEKAQGAGKDAMEALLKYLPVCSPPQKTDFQTDATDAQRQGFWRMPTVALHYVLTGDKKSLDRTVGFMKVLAALEHWETGEEQDSGMGSANLMVGAALAYDWTYDALEPAFRDEFRKKLLLQARRMYYGGHMMRGKDVHYWQNDPQNNHRWHRDAGLALSVLAVAGEGLDDGWILAKTAEELAFLHAWLPEDGTSHESPSYLTFGAPYLTLALHASDRCTGTAFLAHPFFKNVPLFRMQTLTPGLKAVFNFGDSGGTGFINNYLFKCASQHKLKDAQDALVRMSHVDPDAFMYGWFSLVWFDPSLTGGRLENLPRNALFGDLGCAYMREGWEESSVAVFFKCGPYGGHTLNKYRNEADFHHINIAHDDPDAGMFQLFAGGAMLAEDDRYASVKKTTSSHNTILVNGKGQKGEGQGWTQPLKGKDADMDKMACIVGWKEAGDVAIVEGEAGNAYADLARFRRTLVWIRGAYVLVLDDIRAQKEVEIKWLLQGPGVEILAPQGQFRLKKGAAECGLRMTCDRQFTAVVGESTAANRDKLLGYQQLQVTAKGPGVRFVTVLDPWKAGLALEFKSTGDGSAEFTVSGKDINDAWKWTGAAGNDEPSALQGQRKDGAKIELTAKDKFVPGVAAAGVVGK